MYLSTELVVCSLLLSFTLAQQTNPVTTAMKLFNASNTQISSMLQEDIDRLGAKVAAINKMENQLFQRAIVAADAKQKQKAEDLYHQANGLELVEEQYDATAQKIFTVLKELKTQRGSSNVKYSEVQMMLKRNKALENRIMNLNLPLPADIVTPTPQPHLVPRARRSYQMVKLLLSELQNRQNTGNLAI